MSYIKKLLTAALVERSKRQFSPSSSVAHGHIRWCDCHADILSAYIQPSDAVIRLEVRHAVGLAVFVIRARRICVLVVA